MTQKAVLLAQERHKHSEWRAHRERGSLALLRIMAFLSQRFGRRASRVVLHGIALYFFLFAPAARRSSRDYLRLALGRKPTARDRYRQILSFATTIHDRVYLINEHHEMFNITVQNDEIVLAHCATGRGAMLLGAHIGSFELLHTLGRRKPELKIAMAMYEANARKISSILATLNPSCVPDIISLGHIDAMLTVAERLDQGTLVGILGDRTLGQEPVQAVALLGERAFLPTGPMRAAAILRCPVYFMAGLYRGKNNYHVMFEAIADFTEVSGRGREAAVRTAIERYAAVIEQCCRSDPYNWFNFFNFWRRLPADVQA